MAAPILAIDFGTSNTSAVIVVDGRMLPLRNAETGRFSWPTAVFRDGDELKAGSQAEWAKLSRPDLYCDGFKRFLGSPETVALGDAGFPIVDLIARMLRHLRDEATALIGQPIGRTVLTIPSSYGEHDRRRTLMIDAGLKAGFTDVELLPEAVAAALAPLVRAPLAPGSLALVYDLGGGTFDAALVRMADDAEVTVLDQAALEHSGGRAVDERLVEYIRMHTGPEAAAILDPEPDQAPEVAARAELMAHDLVRRLKLILSGQQTATDYSLPSVPPIRLARDEMNSVIDDLLDNTVECCKTLVARAGLTFDDLDAVIRVGGSSRITRVGEVLERLGPPVCEPEDHELAVVQGAARWAARAVQRRLPHSPAGPGDRPLRFDLPGGQTARLTRWLMPRGAVYPAGSALAVVRLRDGSLWHLYDNAASPGLLHHRQIDAGDQIASGDWIATVRPPAPASRFGEDGGGATEAAFSADGGSLAVAVDGTVRIWKTADGTEPQLSEQAGRTALARGLQPGDGIKLVTYHNGTVTLWEPTDGAQLLRIDAPEPLIPAAAHIASGQIALVAGNGESAVIRRSDTSGLGEIRYSAHVQIHDIVLSPDGRAVLAAGEDGFARIWNVETEESLAAFEHDSAVVTARYSADGARVVTNAENYVARVWDVASGEPITEFRYGNHLHCIALSPDGTLLAVGGSGGGVRLWDVNASKEMLALPGSGSVSALVFSPDGNRLAVSAASRPVEVYLLARPV
ncbi:Hsp70 family protein [Actinospica sp. MGRD01-02]|uniref:Hsp70 family protein n=1 Tax=Actinospica acidithermotolerans TaxID=2828514 RepID=A0A941II40_9ACTN|nr:Hsp70 family protein [Actinospica acidithermotolerans]MBR7827924.1 Hsp70 family protein [Actinospica acidithermotolerans]